MHEITLPSGAVVSVSAANKKQIANAEILFGKNAKLIVKKIDELVKIKELDTAKLSAVLDLLNDADATTAFAKKAAGKNLVTAMKNLYKAKTLVAVINGLRAIKMKPVAIQQNAPAKTTRPVKVAAPEANGKIERSKWYVIDHTRHATDTIIKGPFRSEAEAEKNVENKSKRAVAQEAVKGQYCLDEGLTWSQTLGQKQTGGTPGAKQKVPASKAGSLKTIFDTPVNKRAAPGSEMIGPEATKANTALRTAFAKLTPAKQATFIDALYKSLVNADLADFGAKTVEARAAAIQSGIMDNVVDSEDLSVIKRMITKAAK